MHTPLPSLLPSSMFRDLPNTACFGFQMQQPLILNQHVNVLFFFFFLELLIHEIKVKTTLELMSTLRTTQLIRKQKQTTLKSVFCNIYYRYFSNSSWKQKPTDFALL